MTLVFDHRTATIPGEVVRSGVVVPDGGEESLRSLARFVAEGTPSLEVHVATTARSQPPKAKPGRPSLAEALLIGGGVMVLGTGVTLYAIAQDPGDTDSRGNPTPTYQDTAPFAVAAGVASTGVASIGVGIWLLAHGQHEHPPAAPVVSVTPSSAIIGWSGNF